MLKITEVNQTLKITEENGTVVKLTPIGSTSLKISEVGSQGLKGDTPTPSDVQVKQDAEAGNSTPTYNETDPNNPYITSLSYVDANGATNHTKTFNYTTYLGEQVVDTLVSVFTYEGEVWTYTKQLNYKDVGGVPVWDGTDSTVVKV